MIGAQVPWGAAARGAIVQLGLALPLGAALGLLAAPAIAAWARREGGVRAGDVLAGALAICAAVVLAARAAMYADATFHDPFLIAVACALSSSFATVLGVALFAPLRRLLGRLRLPAIVVFTAVVLLGAGGLGAASFVVEAPSRLGLWTVALALVALLAFALALPRVPARASRRVTVIHAAATVLLCACAFGPPGDDETFRARAWPRAVLAPAVDSALRPILDTDGDGFTAVLGGGDCDEGNGARSPWGVEVAGNGRDEDCRFGDLRPQVATPALPPEPAPARIFVLVTIAGLDVGADGKLNADLPETARRLATGIRFTDPVGAAGPLLSIAGLLMRGRLPWGVDPEARGWAPGGPSIPWLVERAGGKAHFVTQRQVKGKKHLEPFFVTSRSFWQTDTFAAAADRATAFLRESGAPHLVWVHLILPKKGDRPAADHALARLLELARSLGARVLVVGLGGDAPASPPAGRRGRHGAPGGPIALLGAGEGTVTAPVGLLDVHPTILRALALEEDAADWPELEAPAGAPLDAPREAAATFWIGRDELVAGAVAAGSGVILDEPAHVFRILPARGKASTLDEDAPSDDPRVVLLRDRLMAPRHAHLNATRAAARLAAAPDALEGQSATFGRSLQVLGCTTRARGWSQVELTIYLRGGEGFGPEQRLHYKVSSIGRRQMQGRLVPLYGLLPFGSFGEDEVIAVPIVFDTRPLGAGSSWLWLGLVDLSAGEDEENAPVEGTGRSGVWASICPFEVTR